MRIYSSDQFTWRPTATGYALPLGRKPLLHVVPDSKYHGMWRVERPDGSHTDMANLSWAKDAALNIALEMLNSLSTAA